MLHAMSFRFFSSSVLNLTSTLRFALTLALALASVAVMGCSKDKKDEADAAADAAPEASVVADAAVDAADAAVVDATVAPLTTTTAAPVRPKATAAPLADPPICQKARAAKQRNSPSFPALEAQCKAAGGTL